jgi:hypothetical protein
MIPYRFECNVLHVLLMLSLPSRHHHCPLSSNSIVVILVCDIRIDLLCVLQGVLWRKRTHHFRQWGPGAKVTGLVMEKFGSEPRSEPEPNRTERYFRVRVQVLTRTGPSVPFRVRVIPEPFRMRSERVLNPNR